LELARITREYDLPLFHAFGVFLEGLANIDGGKPGGGLEGMRLGGKLLRERNAVVYDGLLKISLAEAERRAGDPDRAISIIDEALATCERVDYRAFEAELHRVRGEMHLNPGPANPDAAEMEFRSAIEIAGRQRARSFGLRAALSLAKLRQSLDRPNDALDVLGAALAGFSPTLEMPEIAEARALVEELRGSGSRTDEMPTQPGRKPLDFAPS
jgi:predicted ATPase